MEDVTGVLVFKENENIFFRSIKKQKYTIGRSVNDHIQLTEKGISRSHATLYFANGSCWIIDGDLKGRVSTNGLFVNGKKVSIHKLNQYDVISFCKGVHAFYLENQEGKANDHSLMSAVMKLTNFLGQKKLDEIQGFRDSQDPSVSTSTYLQELKNPFLDDLTRLPNRSAFFDQVKKSIEFSQKISADYKFSVLFVDLDRFKVINDSLGHLIGDQFLIAISEKLAHCIRENDMVARLGGDEFAILLDDLNSFDEAITVAKRIQDILAKPLMIESHELYPSLSIGIALSSLGYETVEEIIRDADTAMYHAKNTGRSRFVVFDEDMHQKASELLRLDGDLRKAIDNQELRLKYQPIVSIKDRCIAGFEALVRWEHPELGTISPAVFIPIAEETNLIYQIGQWVLNEACSQIKLWEANSAIKSKLSVNVNISSKQLADANLVKSIGAILKNHEINPSRLKLEVTESILMNNGSHSIRMLNQLKRMGLQLAIDDFGTGYSSLSYLNRFPIDTLKVDRSFIAEIDQGNQNTSLNITNSIIKLAHSLGVKVVAEGVENLYHLTWLEQQKCDYAQGFLFAAPLDVSAATALAEAGLDWRWKI